MTVGVAGVLEGSPSNDLTANDPRALERLRAVFGHGGYRAGQAEIIDGVLSGTPTLGILPTGAGKSLCYQLPALLVDGVAVVVSPLIALIRDQVNALEARGIRAASITSADESGARREVFRALRSGKLDLLYVAPERFRSPAFLDELSRLQVALLAIDEAHCISQWGHDFRPDYSRLGAIREMLKPPRFLALTATATPEVREDILASLGIPDARVVVTGFDRPNLELTVEDVTGMQAKLAETDRAIRRWLGRKPKSRGEGAAIVYAATRKRSEEVAAGLAGKGWRASAYHAGLASADRAEVQSAFERSELEIVVATTAFGMGIDKADVRVVVHFDIPSSPEAYYQEVGRAGRDGEPAGGVLLFDLGDLRWSYLRLESSCPTAKAVDAAYRKLASWAGDRGKVSASFDEIAEDLERPVGPAVRAALIALEKAGAIAIERDGISILSGAPDLDHAGFDRRERVERSKLDAMIGYVKRASCRRRYFLDYFGDPHGAERCGVCDRCALPDARQLAGEPLNDALKALSCVARMRGRFGKMRVAEVLLGSRAKGVLQARLDELSTHGLLATWSKDEVLELIDSLARAGLVAQTHGEYPKLELTARGAELMRSRGPIELDLRLRRWGDRPAGERAIKEVIEAHGGSAGGGAPATEDRGLYEAFRAWRTKTARDIGMPPYVVAHDSMLAALCRSRPRDLHELSQVKGFGPAKIARYGEEIVSLVREHAGT